MDVASNTIFTDNVSVERTQHGCVRFCYIPKGSRIPAAYRSQPNKSKKGTSMSETIFPPPHFTSNRYGEAGYAQLYRYVPREIFEGADNESEMGVFNHLYQAQNIKDLKSSLEEYVRLGLEPGIFMVT